MSELQWQLRPLERNDLPAVVEISLSGVYSDWTLKNFESCFKENYRSWVLFSGDKIAAFIVVLFNLDELEILNLGVHPVLQRQGLADCLFQQLMEFAADHKLRRIHLEVSADNLPAITLYKKHHFAEVGCRKNYYVTPLGLKNALLFSKECSG